MQITELSNRKIRQIARDLSHLSDTGSWPDSGEVPQWVYDLTTSLQLLSLTVRIEQAKRQAETEIVRRYATLKDEAL